MLSPQTLLRCSLQHQKVTRPCQPRLVLMGCTGSCIFCRSASSTHVPSRLLLKQHLGLAWERMLLVYTNVTHVTTECTLQSTSLMPPPAGSM